MWQSHEGIEYWDVAARLGAAALCAGIVGFDRERTAHPAGLRTHVLVGLGSAAITVAAASLMASQGAGQIDPTRAMQGVVAGIGFLGAGCIIQAGGRVQGLTTAAGIWVVGAVGAVCGLGQYVLAGMTTLLAFVTLTALKAIERRMAAAVGNKASEPPPAEDEKPG